MQNYRDWVRMTALLLLFGFSQAVAFEPEFDKCGFDSRQADRSLARLGDHWGYGYDSLLADLDGWSQNPFITIDSLGASVQNRAIWQLTITGNDTVATEKQTVFFHARTHPNEVQGWWVTEQVINQLLAADEFARTLRENCVFYILPMYNPDGVELEYNRENANGVDLESNWDDDPVQPEVAVLRDRFTELMTSAAPIKVAMNMHSAYGTNRFFYYHDSAGTSPEFALLEQDYIEGVRYYYPDGIQPWYYRISWTSGTATQYPESWFWLNYQEAVMALTYEDMNSDQAGNFDSTASALLQGIADFLEIGTTGGLQSAALPDNPNLLTNYPNPFNPVTRIEFSLADRGWVRLIVNDIRGNTVTTLLDKSLPAGRHTVLFNGGDLATGIYFYRLQSADRWQTGKMLLLK